MSKVNSFSSRHFLLEQLAEGVYAAINAADGWAISNAGIIDLGDRTLVFDASMSPEAARDLCTAAEGFTGHPATIVIDSHYHNDHIWGNQAFPAEVDIISTTRTRELIASDGPKEIQEFQEIAQKHLETLETQIAEAHDKATLDNLKLHITYYQAINATLPILQLRLPNITFSGSLIFKGSRRSAILNTYEGGHCANDTVLYLPNDGIVFMSDLLFIGFHPYLSEGDPEIVRRCIAEIRALQPTILVPGHGPVGQIEDLDEMDEYISTLYVLVNEAIINGANEEEIDKIAMPGKYQHLVFPALFKANLKFLYKRQMPSDAGLVE